LLADREFVSYLCGFLLLLTKLTEPDLLDVRFFVTVPLLLQSLMFTYPVTVQTLVRGACSEVRNQTSGNHLFKMMVKALSAFMTMASTRSQKNTCLYVTRALRARMKTRCFPMRVSVNFEDASLT